MIYVEEKNLEKQVSLLKILLGKNEMDLVAWAYPEAKIKAFLGSPILVDEAGSIESATEYANAKKKRTQRLSIGCDFLGKITKEGAAIKSSIDSLCFYEKDSASWSFCAIPHEGMCLIRANETISAIQAEGYSASLEPPSWW